MELKNDNKKLNSNVRIYDASESNLFIDGNVIQGFPADRPAFGIKDNTLLISQPILRSPNWMKIINGHKFEITSPIDNTHQLKIYGKYSSSEAYIKGNVLFDGNIPSITIMFNTSDRGFTIDERKANDKYSRI